MYIFTKASILHTVLSVATRNVPGIEIPAPPPMVMPFRRATCKKFITVQLLFHANKLGKMNIDFKLSNNLPVANVKNGIIACI